MHIELRPARMGFEFRFDAPLGARYWFRYVALGTGGHQVQGEVEGILSDAGSWKFQAVRFPVIHVGCVSCSILEQPSTEREADAEQSHHSHGSMPVVVMGDLIVPEHPALPEGNATYTGTPYPYS